MPTTWVDALLHKARQEGVSPFPHQAAFMLNNPLDLACRVNYRSAEPRDKQVKDFPSPTTLLMPPS
jgi:hypothetical protein